MRGNHFIIACSFHVYVGVVHRAHSVRDESHIQCNASGVVATDATKIQQCLYLRNTIYENHTDFCC